MPATHPAAPGGGRRWPIRGRKSTFLIYTAAVAGVCVLSYYLAYELRFEFHVTDYWLKSQYEMLRWILPLQLICLYATGVLRPLTARLRARDVLRTVGGVALYTAFLLFIWFRFEGEKNPPRSVIVLQSFLAIPLICLLQGGTPHLYNLLRGEFGRAATAASVRRRALVIGTGYVSYWLIRQLRERPGLSRVPVGVVTLPGEDPRQRWIAGVRVVGALKDLEDLVRQHDADTLLIAVPALAPELVERIITLGNRLRLSVRIVPSPQEMLFGQVRVDQLRPLSLEDILGRNVLDSDIPQIHKLISGRRVLVTGAAGSIGSELCSQILAYEPEVLYILDASEPALFALEQKLIATPGGAARVRPLLYNIRDSAQIEQTLQQTRPQLIFHSAALKHVPMMENFPAEGLRTNTLGTHALARAAARVGTERFIFISTDKAIRPTNAMGASKRLAEILLQQLQQELGPSAMQIISVRFGNVLRSSGSVIPLFERQIKAGGPVTVTDENVIRYFMSIPEAVGLVLQSATLGQGNDIFLLDMGEPMKIIDLARRLITLHGLTPDQDIRINIIGLRPGEKLFEELSYDSEIHQNTPHPRIWRLCATATDLPASTATAKPTAATGEGTKAASPLLEALEALSANANRQTPHAIKATLARLLPDYKPDNRDEPEG